MINRQAIKFLSEWKDSDSRKPLVLRGARQVGKSTLVDSFSEQFKVYLKLNLEKEKDRLLFEQFTDIESLLEAIYLHNRKTVLKVPTLLFIDEIQNSLKAVAMLRYFYEEAPHIHVISAGSLLETLLKSEKISFPVGRVEYYPIRPLSFIEFLEGISEEFDRDLVLDLNADAVHSRVMESFRRFTLVGGMPEAVVQYSKMRDILSVAPVYRSLLTSYIDDAEKYAHDEADLNVVRHCLKAGWKSAAEAITLQNFGGSNYRSREVGAALRTLQKAFLLELVYPVTGTRMPIMPDLRKKPKLMWLDTGLVNFYAGIQTDVFSVQDIQDVWRGRIAEHIVGQELLCLNNSVLAERNFWRRDKDGSDAEVDFVYPFRSKLIPIEVKSGHNAKLKSLHYFMDESPLDLAVRVWSGRLSIDIVKTSKGKEFRLLNLPFYYVCVLDKVLEKYL
ncbi:MAG: AAA family ATPase [Bacteroidales bacterium]|nr:AAA family ATPase [Bacteroidales bacterium]